MSDKVDNRPINENGNRVPVDPAVWKKNEGRWGDKEKAREAGRKGGLKKAENEKKRKVLEEMLADKSKFITGALATAMEDKPEFLVKMIQFLHDTMEDPNTEMADRLKAFDRLQSLTGLQPARQVEKQAVKQDMSYEEIIKQLEAEDVDIKGALNVVEKS